MKHSLKDGIFEFVRPTCFFGVTEVALAVSIAAAAASAIGSMQQANAQANSANYNAQVANTNAQIQQQNAQHAAQAGEVQAERSQQQTRAKTAAIAANQAAAGIDINSGSATSVRAGQDQVGQQDAMNIRANAVQQAYGYNVASWNDQAQSKLDSQQASDAKSAGYMNAASSFLGGASSTMGSYSRFQMNNSSLGMNSFNDNPTGTPGY